MARLEFIVKGSVKGRQGHVEIGSASVPYLDLRGEAAETGQAKLKQLIAAATSEMPPRIAGLRAFVITTPQPSDALALALAPQGIRLIVGPADVPALELVQRFREQLRVIGRAESPTGAPSASAGTPGAPAAQRRPRSESPYAQYPPWFNQAAFDERLRQLQQHWRDEDASKSETNQ